MMLKPGFQQYHLVRSASHAPRQQLLQQRYTTHHAAVFLQGSPIACHSFALSKTGDLISKTSARNPRFLHRRCAHTIAASAPTAKSARQLLRDAPPLNYKERSIEITTCGELYKKWRAEGRRGYEQAPETGAHVPVTYIHTGLDRMEHGDRTERPLTMMFTGAPGQYQDYSYNIPFLDKNGVDVLCFNWPGFALTMATGYWWHSCDEKTRLVIDFLKKLNINKIDMLVSHSTGSTPAVQLVAEEPSIDVKSLALLMPIAARYFRGSQNPVLFNPAFMWAMKSRRGVAIMMPLFQAVMSLIRHPTRGKAYDVFFAYHSSIGCEEHRVEQQLTRIRDRKIPTLVVVSDNDRLLSKEDNRTLLRRLGCDPEKISLYGKGGCLLRSGSGDGLKAIELEDGSHYGFARYPDICNKALLELITRVQGR